MKKRVNLILYMLILILISLISASYCPNGVYPCDENIPFVISKEIINTNQGSCSCPSSGSNSTFNITYDTWYPNYTFFNPFWINYSLITSYSSTFNSTYDKWSYNQTSLDPFSYNFTLVQIINNIFDQDLNKSSDVEFRNMTLSSNLTIKQTNAYAFLVTKSDGTTILRVDTNADYLYTGGIRPRSNGTSDLGVGGATYNNLYLNGTLFGRYYKGNGTGLTNDIYLPLWNNYSLIPIPNNSTLLSLNNITGIDDNACTGTDKVSNVTINNGNLQIVCSTDQTGGVGASSSSDADYNRSTDFTFFEPFIINNAIETGEVGIMNWNYVVQGGSVTANSPVSGNHPGQIRMSTLAVGGSNATVDLGQLWVFDSYTGNITYEWVFNLTTASINTNNYTLVMGFGDNLALVTTPVDGIYFMHNTTIGASGVTTNWTAVTSSNSVRTHNITNIPVVGGYWTKMKIELRNESSVNKVYFYINNTLVAINQQNIPQGSARATGLVFTLRKNGGLTARTLDLDYVYFNQKFQLSRW